MTIELGGDIQLTGFDQFEVGEMIIIKKIIGNYAKKLSDSCKDFQGIHVTVKSIHKTKQNEKFEVHINLQDKGKNITSEITERNLFISIDAAMKKIDEQLKKLT